MGLLSFIGFGLPETSGTFPLNVLHFAVPMFPVERAFYTLVCRIALDTVRRVMDLTSLHYRSESSAEPCRHSRSRFFPPSGCRPACGSVQAKAHSFRVIAALSGVTGKCGGSSTAAFRPPRGVTPHRIPERTALSLVAARPGSDGSARSLLAWIYCGKD